LETINSFYKKEEEKTHTRVVEWSEVNKQQKNKTKTNKPKKKKRK
jgi:hypothetical protein